MARPQMATRGKSELSFFVPGEQDSLLYADMNPALANFYGEITGMDRAMGKLRQELKDLGIDQNTLLWYCSDNGGLPNMGTTGGRGHKADIYEGGVLRRLPFGIG